MAMTEPLMVAIRGIWRALRPSRNSCIKQRSLLSKKTNTDLPVVMPVAEQHFHWPSPYKHIHHLFSLHHKDANVYCLLNAQSMRKKVSSLWSDHANVVYWRNRLLRECDLSSSNSIFCRAQLTCLVSRQLKKTKKTKTKEQTPTHARRTHDARMTHARRTHARTQTEHKHTFTDIDWCT